MKRVILALSAAIAATTAAPASMLTIAAEEVGDDVVFTLNGAIDLTGLTPERGLVGTPLIAPREGIIEFGAGGDVILDGYIIDGPVQTFGLGDFAQPTTFSGSNFAIEEDTFAPVPGSATVIYLARDYVSLSPLVAMMTFASATLDGLGVALGEFSYSLGANEIRFAIGPSDDDGMMMDDNGMMDDMMDGGGMMDDMMDGGDDDVPPIPLPGAWPLFVAGLSAVGLMSRRRRASASG